MAQSTLLSPIVNDRDANLSVGDKDVTWRSPVSYKTELA